MPLRVIIMRVIFSFYSLHSLFLQLKPSEGDYIAYQLDQLLWPSLKALNRSLSSMVAAENVRDWKPLKWLVYLKLDNPFNHGAPADIWYLI